MQTRYLTFTNIIIAVTLLMYLVQTSIAYGSLKLGMNIYFIEANLWYQPLSTMFAHGGVMHLLMNMFVLFQFGNLIESARGKTTFLTLYFVGGILTSLLSFSFMLMMNMNHNLVGASGAISVLLGYIALKDSYNRKGIIIWVLLISFAPLLLGMPIAWYAHIIGFILGWFFGTLRR